VLEQLEYSPVLGAAAQHLQQLQAELELREAEQGWELFASGSVSEYRDRSTSDEESFTGDASRNFQIGLSHPLLGSLRNKEKAVSVSRSAADQQALRLVLERAEQRLLIRSYYARWWAAQTQNEICQQVRPRFEQVSRSIHERLFKAWVRRSEAMEQQHGWNALQRQCTEAEQLGEELRSALNLAVDLAPQARAVPEPLMSQPLAIQHWQSAIEQHPLLRQRQLELELHAGERDVRWYDSVQGSFSLAQSVQQRNDSTRWDKGFIARLAVSMPLDMTASQAARQRQASASYDAARHALRAKRQELQLVLSQRIRAYRQHLRDVDAAREHLRYRQQLWREHRVREPVDMDSGYMSLLDAERSFYLARLEYVRAWQLAWLEQAKLRALVDSYAGSENLLGTSQLRWDSQSQVQVWDQGTYIWDSRELLDSARRDDALRMLQQSDMRRLYVGLTAEQIADGDETRRRLRSLLKDASNLNLQVILLLGEPNWITPLGRSDLLKLLDQYSSIPFSGLHLDLEVEQLGWPVGAQRVVDWLDTLAAVSQRSPWPLTISSHPRWFGEPLPDKPCVPCAIPDDVEVSLMIYVRNPRTALARAAEIARRWPRLTFRLAQSVETSLDNQHSWHGASADLLQEQVLAWRRPLQAAGLSGVDWQDWQHFPR
jgi:outer membrane protein TolC